MTSRRGGTPVDGEFAEVAEALPKDLDLAYYTVLTTLRIHGVNADYLRRLRDSGMRNLSAAQIEESEDSLRGPTVVP